jgi:C1A family cysteine protease
MPEHRYGWRVDTPDARDHLYASPFLGTLPLPPKVDLRDGHMPPVEDQGNLGSCTSFAIAGAVMYTRARLGKPTFTPSHLFIYYGERAIEGTIRSDAGAEIRDGIKVVNKSGVCPESDWPYVISQFAHKPPQRAYADALEHRSVGYQRVRREEAEIKGALASGAPVVVGISVYESLESSEVARTGTVPMPKRGEQLLGGHAILLVGYDDASERWLLRNSWSSTWGQQGYFTLPYRYLLTPSLSADFWTITDVQ